jgi:hypothetical protein
MDQEPWFGLQLIRATYFNRALAALNWMLSRSPIPDSELKLLQKDLAEAEAKTDPSPALAGLRCAALDWYRAPLPTGVGYAPGSTQEQIRLHLWHLVYDLTGSRDRDIITYLDALEALTRIAQMPLPERLDRARLLATEDRVFRAPFQYEVFKARFAVDFLIVTNAESVGRFRVASTALAIERFRIRHPDRLPQTVEELVPEYLAEVTRDPFNGQPVRYKRLTKGYCVYSVGRNGRDDGGIEAKRAWPGGPASAVDDIVFSVER